MSDEGAPVLPDGITTSDDRWRRLLHTADDQTVACPDCDRGGKVRLRHGPNVQYDAGAPLRCQGCGWTGAVTAVVVRPAQGGADNLTPGQLPTDSPVRRLLEADPDEVSIGD